MKHHLEKLTAKPDACHKTHSEALNVLSEVEHDDPAIVQIWQVLSANTELLCAVAACLHHHLAESHQSGDGMRKMVHVSTQ